NAPYAKVGFWIVVGILVVGFVAISILALNRISSPPVSTQIRVSPTPSEWRTFVNPESRFSILFPRKPKESVATTTDRARVMLVRQYYSELDRATAYGISVADLPLTNKLW